MKTSAITLAAVVLLATFVSQAAQPRFVKHGFDSENAFHLTVTGPAQVEVSTNLQTWTQFAMLAQDATLHDLNSRQMEWRFYRAGTGAGLGLIGFVRVPIAGGKMARIGNPFAAPLRLDTPEARLEVFGSTNPAVKISLLANNNLVPHTLDRNSGAWSPALRPINPQEGFIIENLGTRVLTVRLGGEVRQGQVNLKLPQGASLFMPPVPQPGPMAQVLDIPPKDGMQIDIFNEATQQHQVSTFDSLDKAWIPPLPEYRPGRSLLVRTPEAVTWTKSFSAGGR